MLRRRPVARVIFALCDGAAWVVGLGLATWMRYAFEEMRISVSGLLIAIVVAVVAQWLVGIVAQTHPGRFPLGSVDEAINLAKVMFLVGGGGAGCGFCSRYPVGASVGAVVCGFGRARVGWWVAVGGRRIRERAERPDEFAAHRVIIFGVSTSGQQLLRAMLCEPSGGCCRWRCSMMTRSIAGRGCHGLRCWARVRHRHGRAANRRDGAGDRRS